MEDRIQGQLQTNRAKNLFFKNVQQIMEIDPGFLAALEELLSAEDNQVEDEGHSKFITFTTQETVKRLLSINPYLRMDSRQIEGLKEIYRRSWQTIQQTKDVKTTLKEFHYPELSKWLASLYPEEFQKSLKNVSTVNSLTYGEYSAEFQLDLMEIDLIHIKQPVLDIGCGSQANLVRHLRSHNIEAYGIDRHLSVHEPYLEQVDWFDYVFNPDGWGTILSNMGFTNHLNYSYLYDVSQLEGYLLTMKKILESLSINGRFYYAPGLPFVEEKLSARKYDLQRRQKAGNLFVSIVTRIS